MIERGRKRRRRKKFTFFSFLLCSQGERATEKKKPGRVCCFFFSSVSHPLSLSLSTRNQFENDFRSREFDREGDLASFFLCFSREEAGRKPIPFFLSPARQDRPCGISRFFRRREPSFSTKSERVQVSLSSFVTTSSALIGKNKEKGAICCS